MKIVKQKETINSILKRIHDGIFWIEFECTLKGNRKIRGRHVQVSIPYGVDIDKTLKSYIGSVFHKYYADIKKVILTQGISNYGSSGQYKTIILEY